MTTFEMHTQLNQRLQEIASFKRDKYRPEELDMALNKAMFRLLEQGVDAKFQDDQINLSHVSALIQKNRTNEVIIPSSSDIPFEENVPTVYSVVPPDLFWTINGRTEVITDPVACGIAPTLATTTQAEYVAKVPFPTQGGSPPFYANTSITSSGVGGFIYQSPPTIVAGFNSLNSKYIVINNIIESFYRNSTIRVYWERYRDTYSIDTFIFVSNSPLGTVTVNSGAGSNNAVAVQTNYTIYNRGLIPSLPSKTVSVTSAKTSEEDILYQALRQNNFYKTRPIEPIVDQSYDYFIIYTDESFLVTRYYFDYVRKPRTISLNLNQSCELASSTHPRIIDLAVELLRLDTKDQSYPATVQDTQLRTK